MDCSPAYKPTTFTADDGRWQPLVTPGYNEGKYGINLDCNWVIQASKPTSHVLLFVYDSELEGPLFSACDDYIAVNDLPTNSNTSIVREKKWCDYENPRSIISRGNSLHLRMVSDDKLERKGANMSFTEFEDGKCPPNWEELSEFDSCYILVLRPATWVTAQEHCNNLQGNLAMVSSDHQYGKLLELFSSSNEKVWIGMYDAQEENNFKNIDPNRNVWPDKPEIANNSEEKDCIYLDFAARSSKDMYMASHCVSEHAYVCERSKAGPSRPYRAADEVIHEGAIVGATFPIWLIWLVLAILLILLLILINRIWTRCKHNITSPAESEAGSQRDLIVNPSGHSFGQNAAGDYRDSNWNNGYRGNDNSDTLSNRIVPSSWTKGNAIRWDDSPITLGSSLDVDVINSRQKTNIQSRFEPAIEYSAESGRYSPPLIHSTIQSKSSNKIYNIGINTTAQGVQTSRPPTSLSNHSRPIQHGLGDHNGFTMIGASPLDANGGLPEFLKARLGLPPVDRFDRPHIRMLDNVSAISLDDFWSRLDNEQFRSIDVIQRPANDVRPSEAHIPKS